MDSLQKCQVELSYIPSIRKQLQESDELVTAVSEELDHEKRLKAELESELEEQSRSVKRLLKFTNGSDPLDYLSELTEQFENISNELVETQNELQSLEESERLSREQRLDEISSAFYYISDATSMDEIPETLPHELAEVAIKLIEKNKENLL